MVKEKRDKRNMNTRGFDEWATEIDQLTEGAPSGDEILAQFEAGDFSSVDPEFFDQDLEEWEQSIKNKYKKHSKKRKVTQKKDKDFDTTL